MESKTTAKDFFLHLGAIVAMYAVAISFVNLLFTIINKAYPSAVEAMYFYYSAPSYNISMPVATLIIVFPIFVLLSWLLEKSYLVDPTKKQIAVRRWLTYITLFVAGIILVGDLVTVLYKFLDGQDLTTAFVFKALVVLAVAGFIFSYYLQDIRDKIMSKKMWTVVAAVVVVAAIILGFSVIGSPQKQRMTNYDERKVSDLQNIQWQIISYWQKKGGLPNSMQELADPISGFAIPQDPQTGEAYEYKGLSNMTFELCANFNLPSTLQNSVYSTTRTAPVTDPKGATTMDYWTHDKGRYCFSRNIDPTLYPVYKN